MTPAETVQAAADYFGTPAEDITGPRRFAAIMPARVAVAYVLRHRDGLSYPKIGDALGGRDHTSVQHFVKTMSVDFLDRPGFRMFVESLINAAGIPLSARPAPLPEALREPIETEEYTDSCGNVFAIDQHGRTDEDRYERSNTIRGTRLLAQALREAMAA